MSTQHIPERYNSYRQNSKIYFKITHRIDSTMGGALDLHSADLGSIYWHPEHYQECRVPIQV